MEFEEWISQVPREITGDSLWKTEVYRLALYFADTAFEDSVAITKQRNFFGLADQLYRASGSISANIAEGYSYSSPKERARFYTYALGSAREARDHYFRARKILGDDLVQRKIRLLTSIARLLLRMVTNEAGHRIYEESSEYAWIQEE